MSLLYGANRTATIQVMDYGMYGSISQDIFNYLISIEPQLRNVLCKKTLLYEDTFRIFLVKSL